MAHHGKITLFAVSVTTHSIFLVFLTDEYKKVLRVYDMV